MNVGLRCLGAIGIAFVTALAVACGSSRESTYDENADGGGGTFDKDASFGPPGTGPDDPDADLYAKDPPPPWCGPGGTPEPPPIGGTEACPDDKNKPGCVCDTLGEKAPCWTGLRKNRGLGACKDGVATCVRRGEIDNVWSDCEGEVLPTPGATKGAGACTCFSAGQWKIANLSPCSLLQCSAAGPECKPGGSLVTSVTTTSSYLDGDTAQCPAGNTTTAPSQDWSTSTLKVDCAGHFKLCLRIRAGDFDHPSASDCIVGEVCTEADYTKENVEQPWPNLPGWIGADKACGKKWADTPDTQSPGYAEMIVKGKSVRCDAIDDGNGNDFVFNRTKYCPMNCNANPSAPECAACQQSGQGSF